MADKPDSFWATLLGVIVGGGITAATTLYAQRRALGAQTKLAEAAARQAIGGSVVEWRLKQLSELYGPLHALLDQSNAMYRHMNAVLEKADPSQFRLREDTSSPDVDGKVFEIRLNGTWTRFRTVTHIEKVYGQGYGNDDYFDQLVGIGKRMKEVIEKSAGYVRHDQADLSKVLGKYLAHFAVLSMLHEQIKAKAIQSASARPVVGIVVLETASFPIEIQRLVSDGLALINSDLNAWDSRASV